MADININLLNNAEPSFSMAFAVLVAMGLIAKRVFLDACVITDKQLCEQDGSWHCLQRALLHSCTTFVVLYTFSLPPLSIYGAVVGEFILSLTFNTFLRHVYRTGTKASLNTRQRHVRLYEHYVRLHWTVMLAYYALISAGVLLLAPKGLLGT